ncbi:glycosyl transferase family 1 [Hydrogenispora ethanolica]|jgi:hypothetical protein|uniref:Glycosyl transferase family 1 n=1 Tax=Hydrogenispora ethanolica TaxID=1082276 RepID=A0A4R1R485_HYDET|nr:glycosyltransferase [Hydrogenispora ethanolica]TCL60273.1 glycosyl transferase family 1 [Hydrogenispora ethanolica]
MLPSNIRPHRSRRILFIGDIYDKYYSYHYYKFFTRMGHQLMTVCPTGNIPVNGVFSFRKTILPLLQVNGFVPDLVIAAESPPCYWANYQELRKWLHAPMVFLSFDTALRHREHAIFGNDFDMVFISQQDYLDYFYKNCGAKTYWLQYGCDPEVHQPLKNQAEIYDLAFAGSAWCYPRAYQRRIDYLTALQKVFSLKIGEGFWGHQAAELYAQSRMIFNLGLLNGVNPRIYEALSYGKLLLTNRTQSLQGVFADHVHLVFYDNLNHLAALIRHFLRQPDKRLKIAQQGHYKAWLKHTFYHRVDQVLRRVFQEQIYAPIPENG